MRIDLFLKQSRLIKRRKIANEAASKGLVYINDLVAKPSTKVKLGDIITLNLGAKTLVVEVINLNKNNKESMFKLISEEYKSRQL